MTTLAARFEAAAVRLGVAPGSPLILAVSGGPDSMALMHLAAQTVARGWRPQVAHLDHALRAGSADDARFVAEAATSLSLEATVRRTDVASIAVERGDGVEEAGRVARYAFLEELATAAGTDAVVMTGHTADDQAETVLLHLARGTGLAGLAGIAERRGRIVRPLLTERRAELRSALDAAGIAYRIDETNADRRFARNRARAELLPALESLHSGAVEAIARAAGIAAAEAGLIEAAALTELAARRSADGWIDWRPIPASAIGALILRSAAGGPPPAAERIAALLRTAGEGRGGRVIELGDARRAFLRRGRVRILRSV